VLGFAIAWVMVALPFRLLLAKFVLYQVHKSFGLLVLIFCVARLALRAGIGRPEFDADLPDWQRRAATIMHAALYVLLIATPVLGYFVAATSPIRIPTLFLGVINVPHVVGADRMWFALLRQVHRAAAILLVVLAGLHAAAAVHNHRAGLPTLRRMWRAANPQHLRHRPH
jgi:cytochrome b561